MIIFIDEHGRQRPLTEVPIMNRGLLFGDGFFTSLRIHSGRPVFWAEHWLRIVETAEYLGFNVPLSSESLLLMIAESVTAGTHARCRITFYRQGGGKYIPESEVGCALLEMIPLDAGGFQWLPSKTAKLSDLPLVRSEQNRFKLLHKVTQVRAGKLLRSQGFEDGIMLNEHSNVVELLSSNVFIVKNGCAYTPQLDDGCLNGVVRKKLLAAKLAVQSTLSVADLKDADEIFATNSIEGIRPVLFETERATEKTKELFEWLKEEASKA